ncbi:MAG: hypothetical protein P4L90_27095 [Rhodopila sp.]|nr:hypothetical protein [Rhodopila sp.]
MKYPPRLVMDGLRIPEGPVPLNDGSVLVVELEAGRLAGVMQTGENVAFGGPDPWTACVTLSSLGSHAAYDYSGAGQTLAFGG